MNLNVQNISFTQNYLSKINAGKSKKPLNVVEYEYDFYDMLCLKDGVDNWQNGKEEPAAKKILSDYTGSYFLFDSPRKFFGVEDEEGNIKALCEARINDDESDKEKFGTLTVTRTAVDCKDGGNKSENLVSELIGEVKKQSDKYKDVVADEIRSKRYATAVSLDEYGHITEYRINLQA